MGGSEELGLHRITNPAFNVKCRPWRRNLPDPGPAKTRKTTASRYYQLKTGHALTGQLTEAILQFLESTDVGRKAREEEWEQASSGTAEEQEEGVEGAEELMEMEGGGDGGV